MHSSQKPILSYPFQQFVEEFPKKRTKQNAGKFQVSQLSNSSVSLPRLEIQREEIQNRVVRFVQTQPNVPSMMMPVYHSLSTDLPLFKLSKNYLKVPERKPKPNAQKLDKIVKQTKRIGDQSHRTLAQQVDATRMHASYFSANVLKDEILGPQLKSISDPEFFSTLFIGFHDFGRTRQLLFNEEKLRRFLQDLNISNSHFDRMKAILLQELIAMNMPVEYIMPCVWRMETFRFAFTHRRTPLEHLGEQVGLHRISERAYTLVTQDFILSKYFKSADTAGQVLKFSRLLAQLVKYQETPTNVMEFLREKHKMFDLTHVHFAMFKHKVCSSFRDGGLPLKLLWHLIDLIDLYKHDILNYDSIGDLIKKDYGDCKTFTEELHAQCSDKGFDLVLSSDRFKRLVEFTIAQLTSPWRLGIDYRNIWSQLKLRLKPQQVATLQQHLFKLINRLKPHPIVLSDFTEQWEEASMMLLGQQKPFEVLGGWEEIKKYTSALYEETKQDSYLIGIYLDSGSDPHHIMTYEQAFLCSGRRYYKKSDLRSIHERFFITDQVFDMYVKNVQLSLSKCGMEQHLAYMTALVEGYRSVIVLQ